MSYLTHHKPLDRYRKGRRGGVALGDVASTVATISNVSTDPYLSELLCRVNQLSAIKNGNTVPLCPKTQAGLPGGVGIGRAMVPLRGYVWAEQHKWIYPVAAIGVIAVPLLIGIGIGRSSS